MILLQRNFECIKHALKADYIGKTEFSNAKESKKSRTEEDKVSPQTRAQSNKEPMNCSIRLPNPISQFSKVLLFPSLQMVHIKHEGIKFQTPEDCFPMDTLDQWDWLTSDDINKALRPCSFSPHKKRRR